MKTYGAPQFDKDYPKQERMQGRKSFDIYLWKIVKKQIFVDVPLEATDRGVSVMC